jgi:cellulose synthase/poly-beta-1,6-N-acetylglucosamine synthase-like glycosyltransferase
MIEFLLCLAIFVMLAKSRLNYLALPKLPITTAPPPHLTIIIPARNEAHQIARAVASVPHLPVFVVDDASTDETASAALAAGAKVINAPPLPPNAKGKPNACAAGAALAKTKWILFVDADTWFEPAFPASLISYAESNNLQMATAFLNQQCVTLAEKTLLPYAFALYFTGVSARSVNRQGNGTPLANGQCLLFLRSAYEQIGGHTSVIDSVIEDVAIAQQAKKYNLTLRVLRAEHLGHVRMYDGASAIWRGFQKNSFRFLQINPLGGLQVVFSSILLTSWAPLLMVGPHRLLLFLTPFLALLPWYSQRILLAPFAIYFFQLIALNGMLTTLTHRKTDWKGRGV